MKPDGFAILYEVGPCLVIGKPAGLLTQAPPHIDSLERRLRQYLQERDAKPGRVYLGVPHRLDRPVSGALLFARHVRAARRISEQFERRMVDKRYVAVLDGELDDEEGEWVDHIQKIPDQAEAALVTADHPDARVARLRYRVLRRMPGCTCVAIELETGRYHQIRVQAAARHHPVRGDAQYGSLETFGPECADERERCIALHARSIGFYHPMTHEPQTVLAPLPDYWGGLELP
ncbi:MAG: RluA family pseudouridine synthase [Pirellulaceae bacterium]